MNRWNNIDKENIAQQALAQYDLKINTITPIGQSGSTVFKVEDEHGKFYSLRLHIPRISTLEPVWTQPDVLESELVWLEALSRETDLIVPEPVRNREGSFVTRVNDVHCTVLGWVDGEQKPYFSTEQELKAVAEMTAALHRHASQWNPPAGFHRPAVDRSRVQSALDLIKQKAQEGILDADDVQILATAGERAMAMLDAFPKSRLTWGLVHGDLIPPNIVFAGGIACSIDFGACGFAPFVADLACTFFFVHPSARQAYMEWYGNHFPLPEDSVAAIEGMFIALRLIVMRNGLGLPDADSWLPMDVHKSAAREFGRYAKGESFLFSGTPFWE